MIVVTIDCYPHGRPPCDVQDHLAKLIIWNDETGTRELGNYEARLVRGDGPTNPHFLTSENVIASTRIERYERTNKQRHIANLVRDVLRSIGDVDLPGYS